MLHVSDDLTAVTDRCASVTTALRASLGSYGKSSTPAACLELSALETAIQRAASLDDGTSPWPASAKTHVHRLMQALRASLPDR